MRGERDGGRVGWGFADNKAIHVMTGAGRSVRPDRSDALCTLMDGLLGVVWRALTVRVKKEGYTMRTARRVGWPTKTITFKW